MAVIPPDAGVRMRMQAEAGLVEQLQPVRPIQSDLPDLRSGQAFTARVIESLPDNTYKALGGLHILSEVRRQIGKDVV